MDEPALWVPACGAAVKARFLPQAAMTDDYANKQSQLCRAPAGLAQD